MVNDGLVVWEVQSGSEMRGREYGLANWRYVPWSAMDSQGKNRQLDRKRRAVAVHYCADGRSEVAGSARLESQTTKIKHDVLKREEERRGEVSGLRMADG